MISIEPNICTIYVRREGNRFFDRAGNLVAVICLHEHFANLQEGIELEMSFKPTDHKAAIEAQIASIEEAQAIMRQRKSDLISRLVEIDYRAADGDARAGKEDKA